MMKTCCACRASRALADFGKDSKRKDGLQSRCRECRRGDYQSSRERARAYYQRERENILAQQRASRKPGYISAKKHGTYEDALVRTRDYVARRRALRAREGAERIDARVVFERDAWVCQLCGFPVDDAEPYPAPCYPTIDHVIPLAKGGMHTYGNVQTAHARCNSVKGARLDVGTTATRRNSMPLFDQQSGVIA